MIPTLLISHFFPPFSSTSKTASRVLILSVNFMDGNLAQALHNPTSSLLSLHFRFLHVSHKFGLGPCATPRGLPPIVLGGLAFFVKNDVL